jgi:hypothetical protein
MESECDYAGCGRAAAKRVSRVDGDLALCAGHVKQLQRKGRLSPLADTRELTPLERVIVNGSRLLEAGDEDAEYSNALEAFKDACRAWMRANGWRPPDGAAAPWSPPAAETVDGAAAAGRPE